MRIAYVEPVIGLNVYGQELLPHLARYCDVDVVTDAERQRLCADFARSFRILDYARLATCRNDYDQIIFQLRNNSRHVAAYDLLLAYSGVTVLHETKLAGIIGAKTLAQGHRLAFIRQTWLNEGPVVALQTGINLFLLHRDGRKLRLSHLPMNRLAVQQSRGVIVHNQHAARQLQTRYPGLPVCTVRRGVPPAQPLDPAETKQALGLADRFPIVASFGVVAARKRIAEALEAFARVVTRFPQAIYLLVGPSRHFNPDNLVGPLGLEGHVLPTGRVDDDTFHRYLAVTDIGINLRYPSEGETSSTALRLMSYGKPILVTNAGSLAELPDSCTIKVDPGPDEAAQIQSAILKLARHHVLRREMGAAALAYVRKHHTWQQAAQTYHGFLEYLASTKGEYSGQ